MPLTARWAWRESMRTDPRQATAVPALNPTTWREIRRMRSKPPGKAAGERPALLTGRRAVFSAALEQSEQLFTAAAEADDRIRPMVLFYGLSQATRAIVAASTNPDFAGEDRWRLQGHGLTCGGERLRPTNLAEVRVAPSSDRRISAFVTLQDVMSSPRWSDEVEMGALVGAQAELSPFPDRDDWPAIQAHPVFSPVGVTSDDPTYTGLRVEGWGLVPWRDSQRVVARHLEIPDHYAEVAGMRLTVESGPDPLRNQGQWVKAWYPPEQGPVVSGTGVREPHWITPNLAGATRLQQPLVLWWALLFTLSMRARYEPEGWTRDLDPDISTYAVMLQELLEHAMTDCPRHIYLAIHRVST